MRDGVGGRLEDVADPKGPPNKEKNNGEAAEAAAR